MNLKARRFAFACALSFPAVTSAAALAISAGRFWPGDILNIRSPDSEGWSIVQSTPGSWSFARNGDSKNETYVANVSAFPVPPNVDANAFVELIKSGVAHDTPADRFSVRSETFIEEQDRGYLCIRYQGLADDKKAIPKLFGYEAQVLQIYSLYCRHPRVPKLGFAISFSHRSDAPSPGAAQEAQSFMDGIQVPTVAVSPAETPSASAAATP